MDRRSPAHAAVAMVTGPLLALTPDSPVHRFSASDSARDDGPSHTDRGDIMTTHVSDASFDSDVLKASKPVLVDFWAPWCGPCVRMSPILEELADSLKDKVVVAKLNVDENPKISKTYGIRGIPTFMIFKNGQEIGRAHV